MANMYCPYCEEKHEIKAKIKNVLSEYNGQIIKHKTMFYECERVPKGEGIFWSGRMAHKNSKLFEEALMQKGLIKCNYP
ncbi:MAG: hypothetical protein II984_01325 [Clostridia bacterium]|nr:hypothetical protein [Clostridia bacterium]